LVEKPAEIRLLGRQMEVGRIKLGINFELKEMRIL
jgi:hypothetical protein